MLLLLWALTQAKAVVGPKSWPINLNWLIRAPARVTALVAPTRILSLRAVNMPSVGSFSPVDKVERIPLTIDFGPQIPVGDTLSAVSSVTLTAVGGSDSHAASLLWGGAAISGSKVTQWVGPGWAAGITYQLTVTAATASGATISLYAQISAHA